MTEENKLKDKLKDKLNRYNTVLDLLTQIRITLDMMWHSRILNDQLEIAKALVFQELKIVQADLEEIQQK